MAVSIEIAGFDHSGQPIPAASQVGPLVMTGGVHGQDRDTGKIPDDVESQARLMFENLDRMMQAAGGSMNDIVKFTMFVKTPEAKLAVNAQWLRYYPDPAARPARHTLTYEYLPANLLVQCDATAYIEGGRGV
nr:RidA family protein [Sphingomonas sp. CDS-1]